MPFFSFKSKNNPHYIVDTEFGDIQDVPQDILEQKKNWLWKKSICLHFIEIVTIVFWHASASQVLSQLFGTTGLYWLQIFLFLLFLHSTFLMRIELQSILQF